MAGQRAARTARGVLAALALAVALGGAAAGAGCALETRGPALAERAQAPDFSLPSHLGGNVSLADVLRRGPAVLVFYRGHW
ncbi:MAG: hypothetical protein WKG00_38640 [Polyangiaceae bacterium]